MDAKKFYGVYQEALAAGMAAGKAAVPVPMVVQWQHGGALCQEVVEDGMCGFAWVTVKPGTSGFAKWLKAHGYASKGWSGGVVHWVGEFNQSMARKEAYARAFAEVLRDHGFNAYAGSRLD